MSVFVFAHHYYKSSSVSNICRLYRINVSGLRSTNKGSNGKENDLVEVFSRRSIILLDNRSRVMSITAP